MGPRPAHGRRVPHRAWWASTLAGLVCLLLWCQPALAGPVYKVCLTQNPGFVNCTVGGDPSTFSGYEIDLLSMVASNLGWVQVNSSANTSNITQPAYELVCTALRVPAVINILTNKSNSQDMSDCALGMGAATATSERVQMGARFSWPHLHSSLGIMVAADAQQTQFDKWAFLKPFSPQIWAAVLLSTILTPCCLLLYENVIQTGRIPLGFALLNEWRHASYVMFLCCFNLQVLEVLSWPCQLMVVCFAFSNLIVVASYTANLAAVLTAAVVSTGIQTIQDLLGKNVGAHAVYVDRLLKNEHLRTVPMTWGGEPFFLQVKDQLVNGNLDGYVFDRAILQYWMGADDPDCQLRLLDNTQVEPFDYGVAFNWRMDDTVVRNFSLGVLQVQATGFLSLLEERYLSGNVNSCSNQNAYDNALQFGQVSGLYIILGAAAGLGLLMSLYSVWHHHIWKPKRQKAKGQRLSRRRNSLRSMSSNITSDLNVYAAYDSDTQGRGGMPFHVLGKKAHPLVRCPDPAYGDEEVDMELRPEILELKLAREASELRRDVSGLGISEMDDAQVAHLYPSGTTACHHDGGYEPDMQHQELNLPDATSAGAVMPMVSADHAVTIEDGAVAAEQPQEEHTAAGKAALRRSAPMGDNRRFSSLASVTSAVMAAKRLAQKVFVVEGKEDEDPLAPAPGVMLQRAYGFNHGFSNQLVPNPEYPMAVAAASANTAPPRGLVSVSNLQASFIGHQRKSFGSRSSKNGAVPTPHVPVMYPVSYMDPNMMPQIPHPYPNFQQQRSFQHTSAGHSASAAQLSHARSMPLNISYPDMFPMDPGRSAPLYGGHGNSEYGHAMSMSPSGRTHMSPMSVLGYDSFGPASRQSFANISPPVSQGLVGQEDAGVPIPGSRRPSASGTGPLQKFPSRGRNRWQAAMARMPSGSPPVADAGMPSSSSKAPTGDMRRAHSLGPALQKSWSGRSAVNEGVPHAASPTASVLGNSIAPTGISMAPHPNMNPPQQAGAGNISMSHPMGRVLMRTGSAGSGSSGGPSRSSSGRSNPSALPASLSKLMMPGHTARAPSPLQLPGANASPERHVLEGVAEESQGAGHSSSSGPLAHSASVHENRRDQGRGTSDGGVKAASPGSESGTSVNFLPLTPVNTLDLEGPRRVG